MDLKVTNQARTLVDVLDRPELPGGLEEIWRSFGLAWSRAKGEPENYTHRSLLTRAAADQERAKRDRRTRLMLTPAEALKRAALEAVEPSSRYTKSPPSRGSMGFTTP